MCFYLSMLMHPPRLKFRWHPGHFHFICNEAIRKPALPKWHSLSEAQSQGERSRLIKPAANCGLNLKMGGGLLGERLKCVFYSFMLYCWVLFFLKECRSALNDGYDIKHACIYI